MWNAIGAPRQAGTPSNFAAYKTNDHRNNVGMDRAVNLSNRSPDSEDPSARAVSILIANF
jgi:hypothetical protein